METTFVDPITAARAAAELAQASADAGPTQSLGRDEFLKLLVAQLENQDPMNPLQDTEFVAQLATFSSLEQLIGVNDNLEGLALGQANLLNAQALDLIGKDALVESEDQIEIRGGTPDTLVYAVPEAASTATLTIYSADGTAVRVLELDKTASGRVTLDWDGTDEQGNRLPDGEYRIGVNATDLDGEPMSIALFRSLPIDGVAFTDEGIALISGDQEIPFELIMEFRAGQPES